MYYSLKKFRKEYKKTGKYMANLINKQKSAYSNSNRNTSNVTVLPSDDDVPF